MTTQQYPPPIYYTIRTGVRTVFWTILATIFIWSFIMIFSGGKLGATCPIELNADYTYTVTSNSTDWLAGYNCDLPENVEIDDWGNWWWSE